MDLLVNEVIAPVAHLGGESWINRCTFGWLPASYLRMLPRHKDVEPIIDHDRGERPGKNGGESGNKPLVPPRVLITN